MSRLAVFRRFIVPGFLFRLKSVLCTIRFWMSFSPEGLVLVLSAMAKNYGSQIRQVRFRSSCRLLFPCPSFVLMSVQVDECSIRPNSDIHTNIHNRRPQHKSWENKPDWDHFSNFGHRANPTRMGREGPISSFRRVTNEQNWVTRPTPSTAWNRRTRIFYSDIWSLIHSFTMSWPECTFFGCRSVQLLKKQAYCVLTKLRISRVGVEPDLFAMICIHWLAAPPPSEKHKKNKNKQAKKQSRVFCCTGCWGGGSAVWTSPPICRSKCVPQWLYWTDLTLHRPGAGCAARIVQKLEDCVFVSMFQTSTSR